MAKKHVSDTAEAPTVEAVEAPAPVVPTVVHDPKDAWKFGPCSFFLGDEASFEPDYKHEKRRELAYRGLVYELTGIDGDVRVYRKM